MTNNRQHPRKNVSKGTRSAGSNKLDSLRLGRSKMIVPKGFTPWRVHGITTEAELLDFTQRSASLGDPDADTILQLLSVYTVEELIVENIIVIEPSKSV